MCYFTYFVNVTCPSNNTFQFFIHSLVYSFLLSSFSGVATFPNRREITIRGQLSLKPALGTPPSPGSCVHITVQPFVLCSGDFPCNIPVYASKYLKNFKIEDGKINYEVTFELEKIPEDVRISAVFNNGWCSENDTVNWIRDGDYLNEYSQRVRILERKTVFTKNFEISLYKSKGALLHYHVYVLNYYSLFCSQEPSLGANSQVKPNNPIVISRLYDLSTFYSQKISLII